jgi:5'-methylthioadenosine phosphorylase
MLAVLSGSGVPVAAGGAEPDETPYGPASAAVQRTSVGGGDVLVLARHGHDHQIPPHRINYRANLWALREHGATAVLSFGAVGCLRADWAVGDLVVCDQFVNKTWGREDTYFDGPEVRHLSVSNPYCESLRRRTVETAEGEGAVVHDGGVLLAIQGPRYSTRAENRDWQAAGYDVITMTHYPEIVLARELGLCYASLCTVTDHAAVLGDPAMPTESAGHDAVVGNAGTRAESLWRIAAGVRRRVDEFGADAGRDCCAVDPGTDGGEAI